MIDRYCSHIVTTGDRNTLSELYKLIQDELNKHTKNHQLFTINQTMEEAIEWYIENIGEQER